MGTKETVLNRAIYTAEKIRLKVVSEEHEKNAIDRTTAFFCAYFACALFLMFQELLEILRYVFIEDLFGHSFRKPYRSAAYRK